MWATGTFDHENSFLSMQTDGDLVLYSFKFASLWQTHTLNNRTNYLLIENDGNLVINDPDVCVTFYLPEKLLFS